MAHSIPPLRHFFHVFFPILISSVSAEILEGRETSSHYQVSVTLHGYIVNHVTTGQQRSNPFTCIVTVLHIMNFYEELIRNY